MHSVLVIGGVGVDTIVRVPQLPMPLADAVLVEPIERYLGHTGAGWGLGLHTLGVPTILIDLMGDDVEAAFVRERMATAGLDLRIQVSPLGTKRSVNLVAPDGTRMSFYDGRDPGEPPLDPETFEPALAATDHLHVSINDWTRTLLRRALAEGRPISTDLQSWNGTQEHHREFALAADIVTMSGIDLADPQRTAQWIRDEGRARVVAVTFAAQGCAVLDDGGWHVVPAVTIAGRPPVDSNGAGDAFGAAFLAALLAGASPVDAARHGVIAGAWACGSAGTHADPISGSQLDELLTR